MLREAVPGRLGTDWARSTALLDSLVRAAVRDTAGTSPPAGVGQRQRFRQRQGRSDRGRPGSRSASPPRLCRRHRPIVQEGRRRGPGGVRNCAARFRRGRPHRARRRSRNHEGGCPTAREGRAVRRPWHPSPLLEGVEALEHRDPQGRGDGDQRHRLQIQLHLPPPSARPAGRRTLRGSVPRGAVSDPGSWGPKSNSTATWPSTTCPSRSRRRRSPAGIAERTGDPVLRFEKVEPGTSRSCPIESWSPARHLLHGHEARSLLATGRRLLTGGDR